MCARKGAGLDHHGDDGEAQKAAHVGTSSLASTDNPSNSLARSNSLVDLAHRIKIEHEATAVAMQRGLDHAIRAGELLIEAKAHPDIKHGQWLPWLEEHCAMSVRTAQLYMRVAERRSELEAGEGEIRKALRI